MGDFLNNKQKRNLLKLFILLFLSYFNQSGNIECAKWLIKNTKAKEELVMSTLASNIDGFNTR